ncbi:hypothetical protein O1M54_48590 [Streptomyces diastatochromogenes]|nr:hypothetical protein [Streptomyces diastatochromogenes]
MSTLPTLPGRTTEAVRALLRPDSLLSELSYAFGGPYHVLFPELFDSNATAFRKAFAEAGVDGHVYYAKKANKAALFAERAAVLGLGSTWRATASCARRWPPGYAEPIWW